MTKRPVVYAFIDSQNLNLGARSLGWKIDYRKLRLYLKNKYHVERAFMFIGMVADNQELYSSLQLAGFILVFKPTIQYFEDGQSTVKGNVDAELVLYAAAVEYDNYDKAIIVSGDGDFACLAEFLKEKNKLLHIFTPNEKYSRLLIPYGSYIVHLERLKKNLAYKKDQHQRSVETLGLSGHGDESNITKISPSVKQNRREKIRSNDIVYRKPDNFSNEVK
jgi:uncharacterized LabA/DUF88 family protein